jgi:hypothetical protein
LSPGPHQDPIEPTYSGASAALPALPPVPSPALPPPGDAPPVPPPPLPPLPCAEPLPTVAPTSFSADCSMVPVQDVTRAPRKTVKPIPVHEPEKVIILGSSNAASTNRCFRGREPRIPPAPTSVSWVPARGSLSPGFCLLRKFVLWLVDPPLVLWFAVAVRESDKTAILEARRRWALVDARARGDEQRQTLEQKLDALERLYAALDDFGWREALNDDVVVRERWRTLRSKLG